MLNEIDVSCVICLDLAIDAYDTECCHVIICGNCINQNQTKKCPYCNILLNRKLYKNIPISRMATQLCENSKRKKSDRDIMISSIGDYIKHTWTNIEQGSFNMTTIKSLYDITKIADCHTNDIINMIRNLLIKVICNEIKKKSPFNEKIISKSRIDFAVMKQFIYELIKCIEEYQHYIAFHFDDLDVFRTSISQENIFTQLIYDDNDIIHNNLINVMTYLLCDTTIDISLFNNIIGILITMATYNSTYRTNYDIIDELIDKINIYIRNTCLFYIKIDYDAFSRQLVNIYNEINETSELDPLSKIILRYANDIITSVSLVNEYMKSSELNINNQNIFFGSKGFWKTSNKNFKSVGKIPDEFIAECDKFEAFYKKLYPSGRKIMWDFNYGSAEIEIMFNEKCTRTIICTTCQMIILLLFNNKKILTLKEILESTGFIEDDIAPYLLALCHPSVRIIAKKPNYALLSLTDMFQLNYKYNKIDNPYYVPVLKDSNLNSSYNKTQIHDTALKYRIESKIVCIMMSRTDIKYITLVAEVQSIIKESYNEIIYKCIEHLISQEYLELYTKDNVKHLRYLS